MTHARQLALARAATIVAAILCGPDVFTPIRAQRTEVLPNPYQRVDSPLVFPAGRQIGSILGLDVDPNGQDIWVLDTCGGDLQACVTSKTDPILKFDESGKYVESFGGGMLVHPHGLYIDPAGNIWVVDGFGVVDDADETGKGHQVFKFGPDGKLLLTLGTAGVPGKTESTFYWPSDVLVAPTGNIFVADGHSGPSNDRIVKFTKDGKFIKAWGTKGTGQRQFNETHSLAMDSRGRLFVGDRRNRRIQLFDQDGQFLDEWKQFGAPSEIFIDHEDVMYVADSESDEKTNPGVRNGVYIGSAKDGRVTAFVSDTLPNQRQELVVLDRNGNMWTGFTVGRQIRKFVKKQAD